MDNNPFINYVIFLTESINLRSIYFFEFFGFINLNEK